MIRTLIVDDEPLARSRIRTMLGSHDDVEVIAECGTVAEATGLMREQLASLVMLDIDMPLSNGFDLVAAVPAEHRPAVVFVTAHEQFALQAFDASAIDYLLKPVSQDRLDRAMGRVRRFLAHGTGPHQAPRASRRWRERIGVHARGEVVFIKTSSIDWIAAEGNYVRIHAGRQACLMREPLQSIAADMDPSIFVRVHRSAIVNIERVQKLVPGNEGSFSIVLENGTAVSVGPTYRARVQEALGQKS